MVRFPFRIREFPNRSLSLTKHVLGCFTFWAPLRDRTPERLHVIARKFGTSCIFITNSVRPTNPYTCASVETQTYHTKPHLEIRKRTVLSYSPFTNTNTNNNYIRTYVQYKYIRVERPRLFCFLTNNLTQFYVE